MYSKLITVRLYTCSPEIYPDSEVKKCIEKKIKEEMLHPAKLIKQTKWGKVK